jgi:hypothetical protein
LRVRQFVHGVAAAQTRGLCRNGDDERWSEQWLAQVVASHFFYAQRDLILVRDL